MLGCLTEIRKRAYVSIPCKGWSHGLCWAVNEERYSVTSLEAERRLAKALRGSQYEKTSGRKRALRAAHRRSSS
jgi:hypothetical protein